MKDIKTFLEGFAEDNDLNLIVDTSSGLNVESDRNTSDRGSDDDIDTIFLNVIESGSISSSTYGSIISITHSYEIGLIKKCIKQTDGPDYYDDTQYLISLAVKIYKAAVKEYDDISNCSYTTAVDQLDSNNVIVKLMFDIIENDYDTCTEDNE